MRAAVFVAHPDDETLGAGGYLSSIPHGDVWVLSDGVGSRDADFEARVVRQKELGHALLALRAINCTQLKHFPDNAFDTVPLLEITRFIEEAIRGCGPYDVIYTHQPHDLNIDHRLTCQAVLTATRPVPGQTVKAVYGFEVPSSTEWAFGAPPFAPNVFQPLTDDQMERKRQALRCYASELRDFPHPRSIEAVESLARYRGSQCGHPWAEAFQLLREIR